MRGFPGSRDPDLIQHLEIILNHNPTPHHSIQRTYSLNILLVKELLSKDGFFIIESFYLADLLKNKVFDFIYHELHSAFSLKPYAI